VKYPILGVVRGTVLEPPLWIGAQGRGIIRYAAKAGF